MGANNTGARRRISLMGPVAMRFGWDCRREPYTQCNEAENRWL